MLWSVIKSSESTYRDCGSTLGTLLQVQVSNCKNSDPRCVLHRNSNCSISLTFSAKQNVDKIKAVVHGIIMSVPIEFPLPNSDACADSGLTCPIKTGNTYTYNAQLPVLPRYPKITVDVKWELILEKDETADNGNGKEEDTSQDVVCVIIPAKIQ